MAIELVDDVQILDPFLVSVDGLDAAVTPGATKLSTKQSIMDRGSHLNCHDDIEEGQSVMALYDRRSSLAFGRRQSLRCACHGLTLSLGAVGVEP